MYSEKNIEMERELEMKDNSLYKSKTKILKLEEILDNITKADGFDYSNQLRMTAKFEEKEKDLESEIIKLREVVDNYRRQLSMAESELSRNQVKEQNYQRSIRNMELQLKSRSEHSFVNIPTKETLTSPKG